MRFQKSVSVFVAALSLALTDPAHAQSTSADVTFAVPLNLTNLAADITKVRVTCSMPFGNLYANSPQPAMRKGELEIPVTARQVVTTAHVVVAIPPTAISPGHTAGRTQQYNCNLEAYSTALGWSGFNTDDRSGSFRTTQAVQSTKNTTFQW